MISHISIKNFAIIEDCEFSLYPGLNILTGETGSGKSIIIEAISLVLGARADSSMVRTGTDKATIQLIAESNGDDTIITREISAAGKSICKLNGEIISLANLSNHCKLLADIHGQYDHQSLINPEYHLSLIDSYHHDKIEPVKSQVAALYAEYSSFKSELSKLRKAESDRTRQLDFLRFESDEIEKINPMIGEDEELKNKISLLQNSEKIYSTLSSAYEIAVESSPCTIDSLRYMMKELSSLSHISSEFQEINTSITDIFYQLDDLCREIRQKRDMTIFSQEELDEAIARLDLLEKLKKKYGGSIDEVLKYKEHAYTELSKLENAEGRINELNIILEKTTEKLKSLSEELTILRKNSATELCNKISKELYELSFSNADLSVEFDTIQEVFSTNGADVAQFMISTNVGEPLRPLSKIASGGEMSRIMLAFKKITADYDNIPTMIFDEIDTGISGITASIVGKKLKEISNNHQIICITHLPQIAACGTHNYKIIKESDNITTRTYITQLSPNDKTAEIARLLGGVNITETTLKSAEELIQSS